MENLVSPSLPHHSLEPPPPEYSPTRTQVLVMLIHLYFPYLPFFPSLYQFTFIPDIILFQVITPFYSAPPPFGVFILNLQRPTVSTIRNKKVDINNHYSCTVNYGFGDGNISHPHSPLIVGVPPSHISSAFHRFAHTVHYIT